MWLTEYAAARDPNAWNRSIPRALIGPVQARIFGGGLLIAAEEARSGAQPAQVPRRAIVTHERPAVGSWRV